MAVMFLGWWLVRRPQLNLIPTSPPVQPHSHYKWWKLDLVDVETVDLRRDEYEEDKAQGNDEGDNKREARWLRRVFYWIV